MKKIFTLIILIINISNSVSQNLIWVKQTGGSGYDNTNSVALDAQGNIYTTGFFYGTVDFDPSSNVFNLVGGINVSSIFITKSDSSGNFVWAKNIGNSFESQGKSLAVDNLGNVYITGFFERTVDFDPGTGISNLSTIYTGTDAFILKLDTSGNFMWAKQIGAADEYDYGNSIAVDGSGNVYTTGQFRATVDFDSSTSVFNLTASSGTSNMFICKLNTLGNFVWAKKIGSDYSVLPQSIKLDAAGNIYTTGNFQIECDFDPSPVNSLLTASGGSTDIFISKLNNSGNFVWAKRFGSLFFDQGNSIDIDSSGNVYTTGYFSSNTTDFDPGSGIFNLTNAGSKDTFISKLDSSGNFVWAKRIGGSFDDSGNSISVDNNGDIYTTGFFNTTADFDPSTAVYNMTAVVSSSTFISKLNSLGNFVWAKQLPNGTEYSHSVIDNAGNIYTAGSFEGTCDFDPNTNILNLTSNNNFPDNFIHKMGLSNLNSLSIQTEENMFSVFPNPAETFIEININKIGDFEIEIIDVLGKIILKSQNENKFDISSFSKGMYFIKLKKDNILSTKKFIKQ